MKYTALKTPNPMTPQEIVIPVDSQKLADELKEICIKYGLPIWDNECAFAYDGDGDSFAYNVISLGEVADFGKIKFLI